MRNSLNVDGECNTLCATLTAVDAQLPIAIGATPVVNQRQRHLFDIPARHGCYPCAGPGTPVGTGKTTLRNIQATEVPRHTAQLPRHTAQVPRHTAQVPRHTAQVPRQTPREVTLKRDFSLLSVTSPSPSCCHLPCPVACVFFGASSSPSPSLSSRWRDEEDAHDGDGDDDATKKSRMPVTMTRRRRA